MERVFEDTGLPKLFPDLIPLLKQKIHLATWTDQG